MGATNRLIKLNRNRWRNFTPPELTYIKHDNGKCELRVNGENALDISEANAKYIIDKYNQ